MQYVKTGEKLKAHFYKFFIVNIETGCWEWHKVSSHGYGQYMNNYTGYRAHRFSWTLHNGEIPEGLYVCHKCDNKRCVNPDHLFLGDAKDNAHDAMKKKRHCHKETHGCSKLTNIQRDEIVSKFYAGMRRHDIAKEYNVYHRTIQNIVTDPEVIEKYGKRIRPYYASMVGEAHVKSKLKDEDIPIIRQRRLNGEYYKDIAKDYGVSRNTIMLIIDGTNWKHIK